MATLDPGTRAQLGIAMLRRREPPGRWDEIDWDRLSFLHAGDDPLAQLYGNTASGLARYGIPPRQAADHGFAARTDEDGFPDPADAAELRAWWLSHRRNPETEPGSRPPH